MVVKGPSCASNIISPNPTSVGSEILRSPVDVGSSVIYMGFYMSQLVQDFCQQYHWLSTNYHLVYLEAKNTSYKFVSNRPFEEELKDISPNSNLGESLLNQLAGKSEKKHQQKQLVVAVFVGAVVVVVCLNSSKELGGSFFFNLQTSWWFQPI